MINLTALSTVTSASSALGDLILVTPDNDIGIQPQNPAASIQLVPDAFFFNFQEENVVTMTAEITDHYIEDNTTIQDQIALKPIKINVTGYIAELTDIAPKILQPVEFAADKLTTVAAYLPVVSLTALIAYNEAKFLYDTALNLANNAVQTLTGGSTSLNQKFQTQNGSNNQQRAFLKFLGYYNQRQLFTVQTPWVAFKNMAIETVRAVQPSEDRTISNFEITFKKMRFASTFTINPNPTVGAVTADRFAISTASDVSHNTQTLSDTTPLGSVLK